MFLFSDHDNALDPADPRIVADIRSVYDRLPSDSRLALSLRGANHFTFSDNLLVRPRALLGIARVAGFLRLDPRRGLAITADVVRRFLDAHLKGAPAELPRQLLDLYPELQPGLP